MCGGLTPHYFFSLLDHITLRTHYNDVKMGTIASQITSLTIVFSTVCSDAYQRKHQSSASRGPVNSPHKWPLTRKMLPFDDVIMVYSVFTRTHLCNRDSLSIFNHNRYDICWVKLYMYMYLCVMHGCFCAFVRTRKYVFTHRNVLCCVVMIVLLPYWYIPSNL